MAVDLKVVEKTLAGYKVYDAWQYGESLSETLGYMSVSYEILTKVHDHRVLTLQDIQQEKLAEAFKNGSTQYTISESISPNC